MEQFLEIVWEKHRHQFIGAIIVSLNSFAFGNACGWNSPALPSLMVDPEFQNLTELQISWISSLPSLAALVSCPFWGPCLDRFGRKPTLTISAVLNVFGLIIGFFAEHATTLYVSRLVVGCGTIVALVGVPVYITDIADSDIRGSLTGIAQCMIPFGLLFSFLIGWIFPWRLLTLILLIPPVLQLLFTNTRYLPESPRYALSVESYEVGKDSLTWFRQGRSQDEVNSELTHILRSIEDMKNAQYNGGENFFSSKILKSIAICCMLMVFQQLSFVTPLLAFSVIIFQKVGYLDPEVCSMIVGLILIKVSLLSAVLIDSVGRKALLATSGVIMAASHFILALLAFLEIGGLVENPVIRNWFPVFVLFAFFVGASCGFNNIPWLITSEVIPTHLIGLGSQFVLFTQTFVAFNVTFWFQDIIDFFGVQFVFLGSGIMLTLGTIFVILVISETKNQTLEQIHRRLSMASTNLHEHN